MLPATEQLYHEAIGNDLFHFPRIVRYLAPTQFEPPRQGCVNVSDPTKPVDPRCPIGWEFANGYCFAGHDYSGPCRRVETFATPVYSEFRIRLPEDPQPPGGPETPEAGGGTPAPANGGAAALASMSWYRSLPLTKWREDISQAVSHQLAQYATKCGVSWACPPTSQQTPVTGKCPKNWTESSGRDFLAKYPTPGDLHFTAYSTFFATVPNNVPFCFPSEELRKKSPACVQPLDPYNFPKEGTVLHARLVEECGLEWNQPPPPPVAHGATAAPPNALGNFGADPEIAAVEIDLDAQQQEILAAIEKLKGTKRPAPRPKMQILTLEQQSKILAAQNPAQAQLNAEKQNAANPNSGYPEQAQEGGLGDALAARWKAVDVLRMPPDPRAPERPYIPRQEIRFLAEEGLPKEMQTPAWSYDVAAR